MLTLYGVLQLTGTVHLGIKRRGRMDSEISSLELKCLVAP